METIRDSIELRELLEKLLFHKNEKINMTLYPDGSDVEILLEVLQSAIKKNEAREEMERQHDLEEKEIDPEDKGVETLNEEIENNN